MFCFKAPPQGLGLWASLPPNPPPAPTPLVLFHYSLLYVLACYKQQQRKTKESTHFLFYFWVYSLTLKLGSRRVTQRRALAWR